VIAFALDGPGDYDHIGIYIGNDVMIDVPDTGAFVRVDNLATSYWTAVPWGSEVFRLTRWRALLPRAAVIVCLAAGCGTPHPTASRLRPTNEPSPTTTTRALATATPSSTTMRPTTTTTGEQQSSTSSTGSATVLGPSSPCPSSSTPSPTVANGCPQSGAGRENGHPPSSRSSSATSPTRPLGFHRLE
jgi:hypothetical protein